MLERKEIKEKFKSPGICYYAPKYDVVDVKSKCAVTYNVHIDRNDPKFKIQKLN